MKLSLYIIAFLLTTLQASAQTYRLYGNITDSNGDAVPFTSVYIRNSTYGSTANQEGDYEFKLQAGTYKVVYRAVGYLEHVETISLADGSVQRNIKLESEPFVLEPQEGTGNEADPGMEIMRKTIARREHYLTQINGYSCAVYVKGVQRLVSAPKKLLGRHVIEALQVDTGKRSVLYQSESISHYNFRNPDWVKEVMVASKIAGTNAAFSYNKASDLQVNFYKNSLGIQGLSTRRFVSPVADNAFNFYNFKLLGRSIKSGKRIDKIQLIPKRRHEAVYKGNIYIVEGDWRIYGVDLYLTKHDNDINLVDTLNISQQYIPITDSVWLPISAYFDFRGDVLGFKFKGYYLAVYNNYKINPDFPEHFFNGEVLRIDTQANAKSKSYWRSSRPVPLTEIESIDYQKKDSLAAIKNTERYKDSVNHAENHFIPLDLFTGYQIYRRHSRQSYYFYPFYQTIFYNTVEGYGINLKADYIKGYDNGKSFSLTPTLRYGFAANMFNANLGATYTYDPTHQGVFMTKFGTDVLDLNNAGTRSLVFNTLSSLLSENNYVKLYRTRYGLVAWQRELHNGVLFNAQVSYADREQLYNNSFNHIRDYPDKHYTANNPFANPPTVESPLFPKNQALTAKASVTFTIRQQYVTRPDGKYYEPSKYPQIRVNYRKGISGVLSSDVNYDFASVDVFDDKLKVGLLGFSSYKITAGAFLNHRSLYFMDYNHFVGNQGTVFNPTIGNFHFLDFYDYSTDRSFLEAHYEHNFAGNLLSKVPLIRKLKLEEVVGINYLTQANHDNYSGVMNNAAIQSVKSSYSEFYIGVQRFIFRVDYGFAFEGSRKLVQGFRIFYGLR